MFLKSPRWAITILAICLLAVVFPGSYIFPGQESSGGGSKEGAQPSEGLSGQTYRVSVNLVNIICSVYDKNTNSFVTGLSREDFEIYEDGKEQVIENFARETNLPLTIAMLIDTSSSVKPNLQFEQETAADFFHTILQEQDRAMVVEFDPGVTMIQDFTNDANKLASKIYELNAGGPGTKLYDAIYSSCDEKMIRETGRKAIIILSDGEDENSIHDLDQALEMSLRAETIIFTINVLQGSLFGVGDNSKGNDTLKRLAEDTGGRTFSPYADELHETFQKINQELRSQYSIAYTSTNSERDGGYRKIKVKVRGGYQLNYRKGYYAPDKLK
jgi:Ca-activated chloride channel family protein